MKARHECGPSCEPGEPARVGEMQSSRQRACGRVSGTHSSADSSTCFENAACNVAVNDSMRALALVSAASVRASVCSSSGCCC